MPDGMYPQRNRKLLRWIIERDGTSNCYYCDTPTDEAARATLNQKNGRRADAMTIDEIIPRSQGGQRILSNCVIACYSCNQERGRAPADLFLRYKRGETHIITAVRRL